MDSSPKAILWTNTFTDEYQEWSKLPKHNVFVDFVSLSKHVLDTAKLWWISTAYTKSLNVHSNVHWSSWMSYAASICGRFSTNETGLDLFTDVPA